MIGREYGPHRPEDQCKTVEVYPAGKWTELEEVPIHPTLLRQWEHINRLARERVTTDPPPRPEPEVGTEGTSRVAPVRAALSKEDA